MAKQWDLLVRLLMIGDSGVGKTCLICRFCDDTFDSRHSTVGIDFKMKSVLMNGKKVRIQVWDTAGQEKYDTITQQYYRRAQGICLVYDILNVDSFKNLKKKWIRQVKDFAADDVEMILVANKSDMEDSRKVKPGKGKQLAKQLKIPYFETSAKDSENIEQAFLLLADSVIRKNKAEYDRIRLEREGSDLGSTELLQANRQNYCGCA